MTIADRKQIVVNLLLKAQQVAQKEAEAIKSEKNPSLKFVYEHLRKYILSKFLLSPDCGEDNLKELASLSLARSLKLDKNLVRELDKAAPCNNATSESTKKVLLLYSIQRDLNIKPNPAEFVAISTITGLAELIHSQLP